MRTVKVLCMVFVLAIAVYSGCEMLDKAAEITTDTTRGGKQFIEGPAGQHLPADYKAPALGILAALEGAAIAYQEWRRRQNQTITKAIVHGIENAPDAAADDCKQEIAKQMQLNKIATAGKRKVDQLKGQV